MHRDAEVKASGQLLIRLQSEKNGTRKIVLLRLSMLAAGAEIRGSAAQLYMSNAFAAQRTGLIFSAVNVEMNLEITAGPAGVEKIAYGRTTAFDGRGKHLSDLLDQQGVPFSADGSCLPGWADAGAEQAFIGVDIADSGHHSSIHDEILYRLLFFLRQIVKVETIKMFCEWFRTGTFEKFLFQSFCLVRPDDLD